MANSHRIANEGPIEIQGENTSVYLGDYAGGNYTEVESDGTVEFVGDATIWNDENLGAVFLGRGANAPDIVQVNAGTIYLPGFDGVNTTEQLFGSIELPHGYDQGTNLTFHVHWCPVNANAGDVKWQLTYCIVADDVTQPAETTITVTTAAPGVAWRQVRSDFPAINGASLVIGMQIDIRLFRNPSDGADTYESDAVVKTVGFHYQSDTVGSRQIITK